MGVGRSRCCWAPLSSGKVSGVGSKRRDVFLGQDGQVGQSVRRGHGDPSPAESLGHCTGTEESSRVKALERLRRGRFGRASVEPGEEASKVHST